jgi:regulatory protein
LQEWGLPLEREEAVLQYLQTEKFIDEQRYSIAFVRDKYRFNSWGRAKIAQALKLKRIPSVCISKALEEIDDEEYMASLLDQLERKDRSVKARNDYERNGKLIRFAMGRGYEMGDILSCLKKMCCGDGDFD